MGGIINVDLFMQSGKYVAIVTCLTCAPDSHFGASHTLLENKHRNLQSLPSVQPTSSILVVPDPTAHKGPPFPNKKNHAVAKPTPEPWNTRTASPRGLSPLVSHLSSQSTIEREIYIREKKTE